MNHSTDLQGGSLTPDEMAWVAANVDTIRALMRSRPAAAALPNDPVLAAAGLLSSAIGDRLSRLCSKKEAAERSLVRLEHFERCEGGAVYAEQERVHLNAEYEALCAHIAVLSAKKARLASEPRSMFLPLGALVRFRDVPHYRHADCLLQPDDRYPTAGTLAVVTGLRGGGEYPIAVSIGWSFRDGSGMQCEPCGERLMTFFVDPEYVEVVSYATLPDGSEFRGYGFTPTHRRKSMHAGCAEFEMLLVSNGLHWRLHDFGGRQGIEALSATADVARSMPWIEEVVA